MEKSKDNKIIYTKEYLLDYIRELSIKLDRTPKAEDIKNEGKIGLSVYFKNFGKLSDAQKAAGLAPSKRGRYCTQITKEYLLDNLSELSIKLGRIPKAEDIKNEGKIGLSVYFKNFGKLSDAQKAAGLTPSKSGIYSAQYTKEYLLDYLRELSIKLGRTPKTEDIKNEGKIGLSVYYKNFGKFSDAQKVAGFTPNHTQYSKEYLLDYLRELSKKLGKTASGKDIKNEGKIALYTYTKNFGKLSDAQSAAGLSPSKIGIYSTQYTKEYLLDYLRELSIKLGKTPTLADIQNDGKINKSVYFTNFGKLTNAQKAAGLTPCKRGRIKKTYTEEYLLDYLRELSEKLGKTPTCLDIQNDGKINTSVYFIYFGKLTNAQKAAGLTLNSRGGLRTSKRKYTNEYLINHLKELAEQLGRAPNRRDVINANKINISSYYNHFGNLKNAQIEAGLETNINEYKEKFPDEYLINHLKELAEQLGRTPNKKDIADANKINIHYYINRYENYRKAQKAAALEPNISKRKKKYTNEYILNHLKELAEKHGRTPNRRDVINANKISISYYNNHFGKFSNAQLAAGFAPEKTIYRLKYSDEDLLNHLKELVEKLGRTPNTRDVINANKINISNYYNRFVNFNNALIAAGFSPENTICRLKHSDEDLLNHLKELAEKLGRTPKGRDIIDDGKIKISNYNNHFGNLTKAQKQAGLKPSINEIKNKYSDEYLLNYLKELAEQLGKTPSVVEITKAGKVPTLAYFSNFGNINKAQIAAGLVPNIKCDIEKYSIEYLLNHLKELAEQLGRTPARRDIENAHKINPSVYYTRFGTINNAQIAAGFIPTDNANSRKYSDELLLNHLKELAEKLGRTPNRKDIIDDGKIKIFNYYKYFGNFTKAQKQAGFEPIIKKREKKYSDEYLLNYLKEFAEQLGKTPSIVEIIKAGKVSPSAYFSNFGNINKAQIAAGLTPNIKCDIRKYSDEYLLNHLKELAEQLGRTPNRRDLINANKISPSIYYDRFGNFNKVQIAAGFVATGKASSRIYSDEFLLNHLKELAVQLGRTPSMIDIDNHGKVKSKIYASYFGNFSNAQKAAGLVSNNQGGKLKHSDEDLLIHLKELAVQLGRTPKRSDIYKANKISPTIYYNHFGTINNALIAAGLIPNEQKDHKKI